MSSAITVTETGADPDLVAEIKKNAAEVLRVRRTTFNGIRLLDVRAWTLPAVPGAESKPTKKGLTLRPETWRELLAVIGPAVGDGEAETGG